MVLYQEMPEVHSIKPFVPKDARYLLLGSFPGNVSSLKDDWYYGTQRNQFWKILSSVYGVILESKHDKIDLFKKLKLAITDVIYSCEREKGTNLDNNLKNIVYNTEVINKILTDNKIEKIIFSSRFAETKFKKLYKEITMETVTLPSPSPRYAKLSLLDKVKIYKGLLPILTN
jgi:hypoxanthine-DNA glycosylase